MLDVWQTLLGMGGRIMLIMLIDNKAHKAKFLLRVRQLISRMPKYGQALTAMLVVEQNMQCNEACNEAYNMGARNR